MDTGSAAVRVLHAFLRGAAAVLLAYGLDFLGDTDFSSLDPMFVAFVPVIAAFLRMLQSKVSAVPSPEPEENR